MTHPELDVLVAGAGPAGLATAVAAARHGARVLLVERRTRLSPHPRVTGIGTRTVEILRTWGLEDEVRPVPVSPTSALHCPQDRVERALLAHLLDLGVPVGFGCAVTACAQDARGVTATLAGGSTVRARFLVGADGARSAVRVMLGIGVDDLGTLARSLHERVHAEPGPGHAAPDVITGTPAGPGRRAYARQGGERTRAGLATAFRSGSGFLVGDAAHPMRGTGLDTAVHAAHALGWRLAFAARGLGGDALLAGYEAERRPAGRETVLRSLGRSGSPGDTGGFGHDLGGGHGRDALATAVPGARAPHVWVRHDGRRVSTLDLFDGRFTLLTGPTGIGWRSAADTLAKAGLPIAALSAGLDLRGDDDELALRYGLGADGAVLVRPDGRCGPALGGGPPLRALRAAVETVLGS